MTVKELIEELQKCDPNKEVKINRFYNIQYVYYHPKDIVSIGTIEKLVTEKYAEHIVTVACEKLGNYSGQGYEDYRKL